MERKEREQLRDLVADLIRSAGCSCCRADNKWNETNVKLAKLLKVPKFDDGSGNDFYRFGSDPIL